jgi:glutathione S-transferase
LKDYFSNDVGFVVDAHPEPACWPHDPQKRIRTRWYRLVWQSLHDQLLASYQIATQQTQRFQSLAARGSERIADFASAQRVWPLLAAALDSVAEPGYRASSAAESRPPQRAAS